MSAGLVCIFVNRSMPDLVMVAKTTQQAFEKAAELTKALGIATPFTVASERHFFDCDAAESFVHAELDRRGLRDASNRALPIFRAAIYEVIQIISQAPGLSDGPQKGHTNGDTNSDIGVDVPIHQRLRAYMDEAHGVIMKRPVNIIMVGIAALILTVGTVLVLTVHGMKIAGERLVGWRDDKITQEIAQEVQGYYANEQHVTLELSAVLLEVGNVLPPPYGGGWEFESLSAETVETGTVQFKDRRLPAAIAKLTLTFVQRVEGTRRTECILVPQADDDEYQVERYLIGTHCDGSRVMDDGMSMDEWKSKSDFNSE